MEEVHHILELNMEQLIKFNSSSNLILLILLLLMQNITIQISNAMIKMLLVVVVVVAVVVVVVVVVEFNKLVKQCTKMHLTLMVAMQDSQYNSYVMRQSQQHHLMEVKKKQSSKSKWSILIIEWEVLVM